MKDTYHTRQTLNINGKTYHYFSLNELAKTLPKVHQLPFSLKILLENQLRNEDGVSTSKIDIEAFSEWLDKKHSNHEIAFRPARVLMQDFTGVPAVVDLAAMRDAMKTLRGDPEKINPLCPVDLVIDHSVQVDKYGTDQSFIQNVQIEMDRNHERYTFLKWGQETFNNFQAVPPGTGICHQVNLEYLAKGIWSNQKNGEYYAFPDTLVGTDSHTTMINGIGVLGWGVGGIEAEAAMLGQPVSMLIPDVIGFKLEGKLREGITATDLVLTITHMLRQKGVVGKFVEFYGPGLKYLPLADRATIANMAPEYGATCGLFPIDAETIKYMQLTNRDQDTIELVKQYTKAQGMWHDDNAVEAVFSDTLTLNLSDVVPNVAGPKRPQDSVPISNLSKAVQDFLDLNKITDQAKSFPTDDGFDMHHADVVIAAITSCTNTSNPSVMIAAGLLAKKALEKGLKAKPWVKSSLAPGSKVVTDYLKKTDLQKYLDELGFYLVGYGCTTCIGNSGPLNDAIAKTITDNQLVACAVLSGNRNFEGRIHPQVRANWLASPPLVVAYALAGTMKINLDKDPIGENQSGEKIYLKDIWPSTAEIATELTKVTRDMFTKEYSEIFEGDDTWQSIKIASTETYAWDPKSTYVKLPPYFDNMKKTPDAPKNVENARILAILGDSVTTDHISPAGSIKSDSPAGKYLKENGVTTLHFNSYGARRGNHEVMMRGTFANIRIRNEMVPDIEGGFTKHFPDGKQLAIYDAAMEYQKEKIPLVIFAGSEYGTGSSRDWAAKGTLLLGVKAVIAESFERIHRSNLIGMGVLPLEFTNGTTRKTLHLNGSEMIHISGIDNGLKSGAKLKLTITRADGQAETIEVLCRIDTQNELNYYLNGGILQYVLRSLNA
ncbi:MAG: aconitate hydratase AcnA [Gammaproteobacteria bacterium CG_4_10_14_0_8_um_filter_38_16]|nr:MAG: aconitate hydratase AcnA [Gammaproteobacteria bacterium CG_4_10_14_0_8_um_filter_38_16]PJA03654.1 MAG: aconitate hydratase AcnA [Gammaproteobacteria bacterium CG_4_10_14_0_2_um_filter_38_22]PJB11320.1 MAG: aconitate hydratase AcnA [Gammaproteobacteria bacterium CG_4_9_14_3_um_filter_38_9]